MPEQVKSTYDLNPRSTPTPSSRSTDPHEGPAYPFTISGLQGLQSLEQMHPFRLIEGRRMIGF